MMRDFSDPEGQREIHKARTDEARRQFREGEISRAVFGALLFGLGFRTHEINAEILSNHPDGDNW